MVFADEVAVKNTFLHIDIPVEDIEKKGASRRSQSEPPTSRSPHEQAEDLDVCLKRIDSSTEVSTEDPLSEGEGSVESGPSSPGRNGQVQDKNRTPLSSQAPAFRPPQEQYCQPVLRLVVPNPLHTGYLAAKFLTRLQAVANALAVAMSAFLDKAYAEEGAYGVRVVLQAQKKDMKSLELAQQNLAQVTKAGAMCILGGSLQWAESGFLVKLAEVPDPSRACWGMYSHGCCRRGMACTWQHPERSAYLEVVLEETS
mmetsp:Transcript_73950/g.130627  ORF Transcript_73950/g.130627 Transcript_73950/m.130627 type:complete len:256 (+) Transcript_73950:128-895(+)|eukprot:CAMPEP_0197651356 /NCGR_PEP_ID=MMETSP1338-20131121/32169_1 /TAXON_ID=43686 ORGANISM="Pelagodinium beii, Strain RCC1491" /NCGR_SAMPLE_ID=MMETSP1338 /ASSEMBLY_ACC=CAM_ASM_000754 /LENGTH=255 /DNA_ID=CAMNT_0043225971 /DNA_START=128 /DNA_END=895 /DNA_ORIENTATION=+